MFVNSKDISTLSQKMIHPATTETSMNQTEAGGYCFFKSIPLKNHSDFEGILFDKFLILKNDQNSNNYETKFLPRINNF